MATTPGGSSHCRSADADSGHFSIARLHRAQAATHGNRCAPRDLLAFWGTTDKHHPVCRGRLPTPTHRGTVEAGRARSTAQRVDVTARGSVATRPVRVTTARSVVRSSRGPTAWSSWCPVAATWRRAVAERTRRRTSGPAPAVHKDETRFALRRCLAMTARTVAPQGRPRTRGPRLTARWRARGAGPSERRGKDGPRDTRGRHQAEIGRRRGQLSGSIACRPTQRRDHSSFGRRSIEGRGRRQAEFGWSQGHQGLDLAEELFADAGDLAQLVDARETTVRGAPSRMRRASTGPAPGRESRAATSADWDTTRPPPAPPRPLHCHPRRHFHQSRRSRTSEGRANDLTGEGGADLPPSIEQTGNVDRRQVRLRSGPAPAVMASATRDPAASCTSPGLFTARTCTTTTPTWPVPIAPGPAQATPTQRPWPRR